MSTRALFFVVGFLSEFTGLAEMYLMRDLGLDVAECYVASTTIDIVWFLRPWLGNWSDRLGRRHLQLVAIFTLAFVCCATVSLLSNTKNLIALFVIALGVAESAVAIGLTVSDAYVVRLAKSNPHVMPQHHRWRIVGSMVAAGCSAWMLTVPESQRQARTKGVYLIQGCVFLVSGLFAAACLRSRDTYDVVDSTADDVESSTKYDESKSYEWNVFNLAWNDDVVRALVVFVLISCTLPSSGTAVSYFLIGPIGITPATFAIMDVIRGLCNVAATFVDPTLEAKRTMLAFATTGLLLTIPTMMIVCRVVAPILDDRWILFPNVAISNFVGMFLSMSISVNVSRIAPEGKEGGAYNGIVSIPNIGQTVGIPLTFLLTKYYEIDHDEFTNLPQFVALTSVLTSIPLMYAASKV